MKFGWKNGVFSILLTLTHLRDSLICFQSLSSSMVKFMLACLQTCSYRIIFVSHFLAISPFLIPCFITPVKRTGFTNSPFSKTCNILCNLAQDKYDQVFWFLIEILGLEFTACFCNFAPIGKGCVELHFLIGFRSCCWAYLPTVPAGTQWDWSEAFPIWRRGELCEKNIQVALIPRPSFL